MKYEIQRYVNETRNWEVICFSKDFYLAEDAFKFITEKFTSDFFRLICVFDFEGSDKNV